MADAGRIVLNRNEMGQVLGVSQPTLSKYVKQGMPVKQVGSRGVAWEFDAESCVQWLLGRREEQTLQRLGFAEGEEISLEAARTRQAMAMTETANLKNAVMRGELVPARAVLEHWAAQTVAVRTHLRGVPHQLKGSIPHLSSDEVMIARGLIDRALEELADGLPENASGDLENDEGEVEATA